MESVQKDWLAFLAKKRSANEINNTRNCVSGSRVDQRSNEPRNQTNYTGKVNCQSVSGEMALKSSSHGHCPHLPPTFPLTPASRSASALPAISAISAASKSTPKQSTAFQTPVHSNTCWSPTLYSSTAGSPLPAKPGVLTGPPLSLVKSNEPREVITTDALQSYVSAFCTHNFISYDRLMQELWHNQAKTSLKSKFWQGLRTPGTGISRIYKQVKRRMCRASKWMPENDVQLKILVREHGESQWARIGRIMNVPAEICRDRWRNYLICGEKRAQNQWSSEETALLRDAVNQCIAIHQKILWPKVSALMNHRRSRLQCRNKWKQLHNSSEALVEASNKYKALEH